MRRGPAPTRSGSTLLQGAPEEARALVRAFLSDQEERAWLGLLGTYEALVSALDASLLAEHNLPLNAVAALIHIGHAEPGGISISELAERIRLSPSRVSRLAIDLEREGLVERRRGSADTRSTEVVMTEAGRTRLRAAAPSYLSTIRTLLLDRLSARDVRQLVRIWDRVQAPGPRADPERPREARRRDLIRS